MANIAEIGFAANTSGLEQGVTALRKLVPAAVDAENAADGVSDAIANIAAAAAGIATALSNAAKVIAAATGNMNTASSAADKTATSFNKVSLSANGVITAGGKIAPVIVTATNAFGAQAANANKASDALLKYSNAQSRINALTGVTGTSSPVGRAADIDAYGSALDDLRAKYDPLFRASKSYEATLNDINRALKVGALNETQHATAIDNLNAEYTKYAVAGGKASGATGELSYQAKNLSYQLVDITQGLASGVPLFQIFAQQAGQVGQAMASAGKGQNLFKEIGSSIAGILTPMRLLTLGLVALPILFYLAVSSVAASSKALDDLAKSLDVATGKLRGLQTAGQIKGFKHGTNFKLE